MRQPVGRACALEHWQCMCNWPLTRVDGIRTKSTTATSAVITAAAANPREKPAMTPTGLVRLPALRAAADRPVTPSPAPTSCPVIRPAQAEEAEGHTDVGPSTA